MLTKDASCIVLANEIQDSSFRRAEIRNDKIYPNSFIL